MKVQLPSPALIHTTILHHQAAEHHHLQVRPAAVLNLLLEAHNTIWYDPLHWVFFLCIMTSLPTIQGKLVSLIGMELLHHGHAGDVIA